MRRVPKVYCGRGCMWTPFDAGFVSITMTTSTFQDTCRLIGGIVRETPAADVPRRVADLLPPLLDDPDLLTDEHRMTPAEGYARHDVFLCPADAFSVLAVVWPPGISTPIHDHATWCAFGVYEGTIRDTHYVPAGVSGDCPLAEVHRVFERQPGDIAHLPVASPNIHCVHNPTDKPAISIHIYGGNAQKLGPNVEKIYTLAA